MSVLMLVLLGCAQQGEPEVHSPEWSAADVLAPIIERLDGNDDGIVDADEYDAYNYAAPPFEDIDLNGDQNLEASELQAFIAETDPLDFDGEHTRRTPTPRDVVKYFPEPYPVRIVHNVFRFLEGEVRSVTPEAVLPTPKEQLEAAQSRSLTSAESRAVLDAIAAAYREAGLVFPEGLVPTRSKGSKASKASKTKGSKSKGSKAKGSKANDTSRKQSANTKKGKGRTQAPRGKAGKASPR